MLYKERLQYIREEKGLKQYELDELLGFKKGVYGNFERENTNMPIKHLNTICNYFNVSMDYVLEFSNIINYKDSRNNIDKKLISKRLKELREDFDLTQEELANSIGYAKSNISECERQTRLISILVLYSICKKYKISADYLLGKIDYHKNLIG